MDVNGFSGQVAAASSADLQTSQSQRVGYDNASQLPTDFASVLESYRAKSDVMDNTVRNSVQSGGENGKMLRQLADLYSYSVDTQLLVRASSQVTSGVRQLMSGQ